MIIEHDLPTIESSDYPRTVFKALVGSFVIFSIEHSLDESLDWPKICAKGLKSIQTGFEMPNPLDDEAEINNPSGSAQLHMEVDDLEYALVAYGCKLLETFDTNEHDELPRIDDLLITIDSARQSTGDGPPSDFDNQLG
jgi:hypothetical protein